MRKCLSVRMETGVERCAFSASLVRRQGTNGEQKRKIALNKHARSRVFIANNAFAVCADREKNVNSDIRVTSSWH